MVNGTHQPQTFLLGFSVSNPVPFVHSGTVQLGAGGY